MLKRVVEEGERHINQVSNYACILQRCANAKDLVAGKLAHAHILNAGYGFNTLLRDQLIKMYSTCGSLDDAVGVFETVPCRNLITYNFMISAFIHHGYDHRAQSLFTRMQEFGLKPDAHTYSRILGSCSSPEALITGKAIHHRILEDPSQMNLVVWNALIKMYTQCRSIEEARDVFDSMPQKNVISWNSIISAYAYHGHLREAVEMYDAMTVEPNETTFACVLGACSNLEKGKRIHQRSVTFRCDRDVKVQNALVYMYAKCGCVSLAEECFTEVEQRDVVSWNTMIAAYAQNGHRKQALKLFLTMDFEGIAQDSVTFTNVVAACERLSECKSFYERIKASGFESHLSVRNGLVGMYARAGSLEQARVVFDRTEHKNMTSWTTMLVAYAQRGHDKEALKLYEEMKKQHVDPDFVLFPTIVTACSSLEQGRTIHAHITATGSQTVSSDNALVTMYANSGSIVDAKNVFDGMPEKNLVSWTAMISAYAQLGYLSEAVETYEEMERQGVQPAPITLALVLGAYSELGSLAEGRKFHDKVAARGFGAEVIVQNALVNMYGKCGSVESAEHVFGDMKSKNVISWTAMLAVYARNALPQQALALYADMALDGTRPSSVTFTCILAACSQAGLMDEGQRHLFSMTADYGMQPTEEHYACVVDLLGRAGWLREAEEFIGARRSKDDDVIWRALLSACKLHCDAEIAGSAANRVSSLVPGDTSSYILLSNLHAELGDRT